MLWPPSPCAVAKAAAGPESEVLSQDACRSAAAMAARKAMPSLTSWVCPSALGAPLRTPARGERLPEPAAKPGARCRGQWCHKWPQGQHHLAEDGEEWQELHLTGLKASGTVLGGTTRRPGACEEKLFWSRVGTGHLMKAQIFTFSPLSMICRGQVRHKAGELHVLPEWVGR